MTDIIKASAVVALAIVEGVQESSDDRDLSEGLERTLARIRQVFDRRSLKILGNAIAFPDDQERRLELVVALSRHAARDRVFATELLALAERIENRPNPNLRIFSGRDSYVAFKDIVFTQDSNEQALIAATKMGSAFAMRNTNPRSREALYLNISEEIASAANANDVYDIYHALEVNWGRAVSESFLLGRQLTLLLGNLDGLLLPETRELVVRRIMLRTGDEQLAKSMRRRLAALDRDGPEYLKDALRCVWPLLKYLTISTKHEDHPKIRTWLVSEEDAVVDYPEDESSEDSDFREFLEHLVAADVHKEDPDVALFWGTINGDRELVEDALSRGGDPSVTNSAIIARYAKRFSR